MTSCTCCTPFPSESTTTRTSAPSPAATAPRRDRGCDRTATCWPVHPPTAADTATSPNVRPQLRISGAASATRGVTERGGDNCSTTSSTRTVPGSTAAPAPRQASTRPSTTSSSPTTAHVADPSDGCADTGRDTGNRFGNRTELALEENLEWSTCSPRRRATAGVGALTRTGDRVAASRQGAAGTSAAGNSSAMTAAGGFSALGSREAKTVSRTSSGFPSDDTKMRRAGHARGSC
mmetsp:Transcript_92161/g.246359  ORF Transcript_92161/g.246359 Transcript_92161/m.246359 type:complete len:235 (-) Transcript_92161:397-1101(-)